MLKCLIVLCVGTTLVVAAPAPQQKTIDFLLDLNQDVLDKEEVQASVKPISQAQVGTTTERNAGREPAPVFEAQADVQEIPREPRPTSSQLNRDREEVEDQEEREDQEVQGEDGGSNSEDDSEQQDQQSDSKDEDQDQDQDQDSKDNKQDRAEDTTIRVYGPEDENDENDESLQHKEQQDSQQENQRKIEPEVQRQPQQDIQQPIQDSLPVQIDPRQPEVQISQHADIVKQFNEVVDQRGTDLLQEIDQVTIPEVISEQPGSLNEHQEIEVKPDQLFNHGSIVIDKTTFADEDLPSTTPFSNKKWNHDHGPPGFGPWHPKFPGGFPGHPHGDESGRPPFFGMPPFNGPPPRFDGPPHWHFHNHSHDHRDWHHHDHDHDHGFHGHGFHRGGPWKWNRS